MANKVIETSTAYIMAGTKQNASGAFDAFVIKTRKQSKLNDLKKAHKRKELLRVRKKIVFK